jgi:hypothetical protein
MITKEIKDFLAFLSGEGYSGNVNQAAYEYLVNAGYSGQLNEMWYDFLRNEGYTGTLPNMMSAWVNDGFAVSGGATGAFSNAFANAFDI